MKKLPIILIVLFPLFSFAQWYKSDIDTLGMLDAASFLNKDTFIISSNGRLSLTPNNGQKFFRINGYTGGPTSYLKYKSPDTIYAIPYEFKGLLKSYDAGKTWFTQTLLMPNGDTAFQKNPVIYFGFFDNANGIILGDSLNGTAQVFLTHNGGQTWEFYSHPSIDQIYPRDLSELYYTSRNHYIFQNGTAKILIGLGRSLLTLSQYGRIWSLDTASNWQPLRVAFKDELNGIAKTNVPSGLAKTTDGGNTWIEIPGDHLKQSSGTLSYVKGTAKYPDFYLAGIEESYASYDDGATWQLFDTINHGSGTVFFRDAETGICSELGAGAPIYYYKPLNTGIRDVLNKEKTKTAVYPNPAQNWVKFPSIFPSIQLWDLKGKLIASDANTNQLDISFIPDGLYLIKVIDVNHISSTQKLLIQH